MHWRGETRPDTWTAPGRRSPWRRGCRRWRTTTLAPTPSPAAPTPLSPSSPGSRSRGRSSCDEAPADSAFDRLRRSRRWSEVAASIESSRRPISTSTTAFELPERDLTAEGTAWDAKTGNLYLSSLYKRKIVTIGPDGTARDFITPGQDGIGPVVGIEVDAARRGLWAASMVLQEAGIPLSDTTLHGTRTALPLRRGHRPAATAVRARAHGRAPPRVQRPDRHAERRCVRHG